MSKAQVLPPSAEPTEQDQHARRQKALREIVETIVLTLLIFFAVHFSIQPVHVDGPSMQPGLHTGEVLLVNLLTYDFSSPQRGDIIVFHPPGEPSVEYVKRIIGIPGDTISITATAVYVDGKKLNEPYIAALAPGQDESVVVIPSLKLGKDDYFVLGDNRLNSRDSRFFDGPVTRQSIIGKAQLVIFPFNAIEWLPNFSSVFSGVHA